MTAAFALGVDIGGTATKMGLVSRSGQVVRRDEQLTPHHLPAETLVEAITARMETLLRDAARQGARPDGIGVSLCGYLSDDGQRPDYINLHALDHYPLADSLRERFGLPVVMDNDMNAGVLGEYHFGAGQGVDRLMVVTVGTGIGMGVMLGGQVVRLLGGTVGNPGHTIVAPDGPVCVAGCRGCLESLASAGPISRRAEDMARSQRASLLAKRLAEKGKLTPEDLLWAAEAGDESACDLWNETGKWLGRGLATWVEIFGPQVVVLGGGVGQAGHWLLEPMEREMRRTGEPYFTRRVQPLRQSTLGRDIAMLGAASYYLFPENAPRWGNG